MAKTSGKSVVANAAAHLAESGSVGGACAMSSGLFVTGTDTGVGKTRVTAALAAAIGRLLDGRDAGGDANGDADAGNGGWLGAGVDAGSGCGSGDGGVDAEGSVGSGGRREADAASEGIGPGAAPSADEGAAREAAADGDNAARPAVHVWKPVQTGVEAPDDPLSDSRRLRDGGALEQSAASIATLTYAPPLAPWMAARRSGEAIDYDRLLNEGLARLARCRFMLVEGAGGLAVPLTERKLIADLAADLGLPLLIVARPGLGTVNHTLLTIAFARARGIPIAGVVLNGFEEGETTQQALEENAEMIEAFGQVKVLGTLPFIVEPEWEDWERSEPGKASELRERWIRAVETNVELRRLCGLHPN